VQSKDRIQRILDDPATSATERREAQAALDNINNEDGEFSEENIFRLLWADGVIDMDPQYLRALYLADSKTSIQWAWLKFWADRLRSGSSTLRKFAECRINMLADEVRIPEDVRRASADFLAQLKQRKHGESLPPISIPGNEQWRTMSNEELHQHAVLHKKSWTNAFYTVR
jgi:hypothetical protein